MTRDKTEKAPGDRDAQDPPRKEKVLHTRIPAVLEEELKRSARALRVPVSNLVRTILEDALAAADAVGRAAEEELRGAAERLGDERRRWKEGAEASGEAVASRAGEGGDEPPKSEGEAGGGLDGVIGYQSLILAVDATCALCGRPLACGEEAFLGVRDERGGPRVIVGPECLPGREKEEREEQDHG